MSTTTSPSPLAPSARRPSWESRSDKIRAEHIERLAVVYVRQSTPQQVLDHQESTRLQYNLKNRALDLGWPQDRVLVIDDDLGKSGATAEGRAGFQRLVSEVSLGRVGIIMGLEMSRLARCCKDWHQLLEVSALFATLIADLDGVYDPINFNDRLLLGLKGTMSEAELHIIRQRLNQGRINKARRGELVFPLPTGYVWQSGKIALDPDEQVQNVVRLIFRVFAELGTVNATLNYLVKNNIQIGIRVRSSLGKGELEWRRPNRRTVLETLKNPIFAGAYAYGRRQVDPRRKKPGRPSTGLVQCQPEDWIALLKDRLPAYISWEQHEENLAQIQQNRSRWNTRGAARRGPSLLTGLIVCAKCGRKMTIAYRGSQQQHYYVCASQVTRCGGEVCQIVSGRPLDRYVTEQALQALAPASLELSLEAAKNLQRERDELAKIWGQRLERARYEVERAARQYRLVEPENRLVARQLERDWEEKLVTERNLQDDHQRFQQKQRRLLSDDEREAIRKLADDIPALWNVATTTDQDRKEILRQVIDEIRVHAQGRTERVGVEIRWAGGAQTRGVLIRPVGKLEDLSYFSQVCDRIRALTAQEVFVEEIAAQLTREGFRPPKGQGAFAVCAVTRLRRTLDLPEVRSRSKTRTGLREHEWWLPELARKLGAHYGTLETWIRHGTLHSHQAKGRFHRWIVWADDAELARLKERLERPHPKRYESLDLNQKEPQN